MIPAKGSGIAMILKSMPITRSPTIAHGQNSHALISLFFCSMGTSYFFEKKCIAATRQKPKNRAYAQPGIAVTGITLVLRSTIPKTRIPTVA